MVPHVTLEPCGDASIYSPNFKLISFSNSFLSSLKVEGHLVLRSLCYYECLGWGDGSGGKMLRA